jgi:hypothetical protein
MKESREVRGSGVGPRLIRPRREGRVWRGARVWFSDHFWVWVWVWLVGGGGEGLGLGGLSVIW